MKILKYIILLLLLVAIAGFVFIATQPSDYSIKKTKEIAISKDVVFNFVSDFTNWNYWNPFYSQTSVETISENLKIYTLSNAKQSVVYETLNSYATDSIQQKFKLNNEIQDLVWKFQSTTKGTLITYEARGHLTLKEKIFSFLYGGAQNYLGEEFEKSLVNIERYLVKELNTYKITINGIVTQPESLFIAKKDSSSIKDFTVNFKNHFPSILSFAKENNLTYKEYPFILFDKWDSINNTTKYKAGLFVQEEIITSEGSDISGGILPEYKAVKVTLIGNHLHNKKAWDEAFRYMSKNKLTEDLTGNYLEIYKVYNATEKQPSKWVTEIYIPIKLSPKRKVVNPSASATETINQPSEPNVSPTIED